MQYISRFINWCKPSYASVICVTFETCLSLLYQFVNLALKSAMAVIRKKNFCAKFFNVTLKLSAKVSRLTWWYVKGYKITNFITNLQFKTKTFVQITNIYNSLRQRTPTIYTNSTMFCIRVIVTTKESVPMNLKFVIIGGASRIKIYFW